MYGEALGGSKIFVFTRNPSTEDLIFMKVYGWKRIADPIQAISAHERTTQPNLDWLNDVAPADRDFQVIENSQTHFQKIFSQAVRTLGLNRREFYQRRFTAAKLVYPELQARYTTTLLLAPSGAGKSALVSKIARLIDGDSQVVWPDRSRFWESMPPSELLALGMQHLDTLEGLGRTIVFNPSVEALKEFLKVRKVRVVALKISQSSLLRNLKKRVEVDGNFSQPGPESLSDGMASMKAYISLADEVIDLDSPDHLTRIKLEVAEGEFTGVVRGKLRVDVSGHVLTLFAASFYGQMDPERYLQTYAGMLKLTRRKTPVPLLKRIRPRLAERAAVTPNVLWHRYDECVIAVDTAVTWLKDLGEDEAILLTHKHLYLKAFARLLKAEPHFGVGKTITDLAYDR
jgi:hypothetical protein